MVYLKIKENTAEAKLMIEFLKSQPWVEIIEKNKLLEEIEISLKEVKLMNDGKIKKKSLKQMLNGK